MTAAIIAPMLMNSSSGSASLASIVSIIYVSGSVRGSHIPICRVPFQSAV